jgi:hypothetical protein
MFPITVSISGCTRWNMAGNTDMIRDITAKTLLSSSTQPDPWFGIKYTIPATGAILKGRPAMDAQALAKHAQRDEHALQDLLDGISPDIQKSVIRESSSKAILLLSETQPAVLLPRWPYFVKLLRSSNGFSKYVAIHTIANLVSAGDEGRFEKSFNTFYKLLDDESVMVASHVAGVSGQIARAKPALRPKITQRLLGIPKTHFPAERRALIISYALLSLDEYFGETTAREQDRILAFVRQQLDAASPKTRRLAKDFIKKWTEQPA